MQLYIKKLELKNFVSYKELSLEFPRSGVFFVKGDNQSATECTSNGAGKSTIFDAVVFGLYGTSMRGLKQDLIREGSTEATVKLLLDLNGKDLEIVRTYRKAAPSLEVKYDSKSLTSEEQLAQLLGVNQTTFLLATYLSSTSVRKFSSATNAEKKLLLESLILDFKVLAEAAKQKKTALEEELQTAAKEADALKQEIASLTSLIGEAVDLAPFESSRQTLLQNLQVSSEAEQQLLTKIGECKSELVKRSELIKTLTSKISLLDKYVECPVCLTKLTPAYKKKVKQILQQSLEQYTKEEEKYQATYTELQADLVKTRQQKEALSAERVEVEKSLAQAKKTVEIQAKVKTRLDELQEALNKLQQYQKERTPELLAARFWYQAFSSSRGLKSYVMSNIVTALNNRLQAYARCLFDSISPRLLYEENEILLSLGDRDYAQLSGGEKRRVDIAVLLALRDIFAAKLDVRFAFLDEVFDVLDTEGKARCISLLKSSQDKLVFVVTQEEIDEEEPALIVTKKDNVSYAAWSTT